MNWKITLLACLLIIGVAAAVTTAIFRTEPTAERTAATRETAMLVEVTTVRRDTFRPTIVAMGQVEPARDIALSPRVAGQVAAMSPAFTPGGVVRQGDWLLRLDPADYRNRLQQRENELRQAEAALQIEMGLQEIARQDYALLGEDLMLKDKSLVLRQPQLSAARARVAMARTAVDQAQLELARTTIRAPFDAQVLTREVNLGSQVAPGDALGRLAGTDIYWVVATVPTAKLRWIAVPDASQEAPASVRIRDPAAWPEDVFRGGQVTQLIGALEDQTRLARLLISVADPLALTSADRPKPPLLIGAFVEARIQAVAIEDVIRLDRDYLRNNERVWVMTDGKLVIRPVEVVFRDARYAYIGKGLADGEQVVISNLATVTEGAPLRLAQADETQNNPTDQAMNSAGGASN